MSEKKYDVVGIGNAIVDIIARCDDEFLERLGSFKGTMMLVENPTITTLYKEIGPAQECSGGSCANSLAAIASLGGRAAFIGKVRDDEMGDIFRHDITSVGVAFDTPAATSGEASARCIVLVTPDGQRTMHTYLGICSNVKESDMDEALLAQGKVLYIEGYLWDQHDAIAAIRRAIKIAKANDVKVAFSLSDLFCVERHRSDFMELIENDIDILFANETELRALCTVKTYEDAVAKIKGKCEIACLTRSEKGSAIVTANEHIAIAATPVNAVVDTTGAGDLYAAGFLYGYTQGWSLKASGELASACAGKVIQQIGARVQEPLAHLIAA